MSRSISVLCLFSLLISIASAAVASESEGGWPQWRGPHHSGIVKDVALETNWRSEPPQRLWEAQIGIGFSSIAIHNGRAYTMGYADKKNTVFCFDLGSGRQIWTFDYKADKDAKMYEGGPNATPSVSGEGPSTRVYTFGKQGQVHCLSGEDGRVIWNVELKDLGYKEPQWGFTGGPRLWQDLVLLNAGESGIALNQKDGNVVWKSDKEKPAYSVPVVFDHKGKPAIALMGKQDLVVVDAVSGQRLWNYRWKTSWDINAADPIVFGEKIYISSGYGKGSALIDFSSGKPQEVWKNKSMRNQFNSSVLIGGYLYGIDGQERGDASLVCLDFHSGEVAWEQDGFKVGSVIATGAHLLILDGEGDLVAARISPKSYQEVARFKILDGKCWTPPALAGHTLLARNAKGRLVCYRLPDGTAAVNLSQR